MGGSGFSFSSKHPFTLMEGRLGIYEKRPFQPMSIDGVNQQSTILRANGGNRQQERMINDKRRTLWRTVWNSYQGAEVLRIDATERMPARALITPNKVKADYDEKVISIDYEFHFEPGSVFEWLNTNTYWLVYLQELSELAYFRGNIRRCQYIIEWEDEEGNRQKTYAAIRGPVETKIDYIQKHGISVDRPNYSLNILMPRNEETLAYFHRYKKFYLNQIEPEENQERICWRVEAIDSISTPGILEVNATEYYSNVFEDDVEEGIVGGLIVEPVTPNTEAQERTIEGETFVMPKKEYVYTCKSIEEGAQWWVDRKYPVRLIAVKDTEWPTVKLIWMAPNSGQCVLHYGECEKTVVAQSLF